MLGSPRCLEKPKNQVWLIIFFPCLQLVHPLAILFLAGMRIIFLYFGPVQLKPGNVDKQSHSSGGDITGDTTGASNPIISSSIVNSSRGTAGDAP